MLKTVEAIKAQTSEKNPSMTFPPSYHTYKLYHLLRRKSSVYFSFFSFFIKQIMN